MVFDARQTLDQRFHRLERRFVMTLTLGFGLVLIMMVASGVMGLRAMSRIDTEADAMSGRFLRDTKLIDRLVQKQSTLGVLIYSLAGEQGGKSLVSFAQRFDVEHRRLENLTDEALSEKLDPDERIAWQTVRDSAQPLYAELRSLVSQQKYNSPAVLTNYERLTTASTRLMEAAYADAARSRTAQLAGDAGELESARNLFVMALALSGLFAAVSGWLAVSLFETLKRQAATLADLSLHTLAEHEDNARRFSREMHDEFGQTLNVIGCNLAVTKPLDQDSFERLRDSLALVKEAQGAARELSQLLRPRILDDFGLDAGLRELARGFSQRTGIVVEYRSQVRERLAFPVETHLFRITQEALTNTARHSVATNVDIRLDKAKDLLVLAVKDNGQGFPAGNQDHLGLGFLGMRERVRAIGGRLEVYSQPGDGVAIRVELPLLAATPASGG